MFLSHLSLTNVRTVGSMELDFSAGTNSNRRWTFLLGENGCGKSSVLKATALLLAGSAALPELLGEPDHWIRHGARQCRIAAKLNLRGAPQTVTLVIRRGDGLMAIYQRNVAAFQVLDDAIAQANRHCFILGYGACRHPSSASAGIGSTTQNARARGLTSLFNADTPLVTLEQWAMDLDYRKGRHALEAMRHALDRLLPGVVFTGIDKERRQLLFKTQDGEVPLRQLSDGYQSMAAWCGDLLFRITERYPLRKDPLNVRGLLLIDEIDLHLHPNWRRMLISFLSETLPNFQFLVTTHSALTAQQCGTGALHVLRRVGRSQSPKLVSFVGEPRTMLLHQLLLSPMFNLSSLDSVAVQQARLQIGTLRKAAPSRNAAQTRRLREMQALLQSATDWDAVPAYAKAQASLLKEIRQALAQNGSEADISVDKLRSKVRSLGTVA